MKNIQPPIAAQKPHTLEAHGDKRTDNYFWMRLTDEQKEDKKPDVQTQEVYDFLNAENSYTKAQLAHTETFQDQLYNEIVGRIKKDDSSVPYFKNGYWYYTRYEEGQEYAIYCRKAKELANKEEVILDVNELAKEHSYYSVSGLSISPNNKILAFGEDTLSRRIYTLRFLNLETGEFLTDTIPNTNGDGAWANDNATYFYTSKNEVTLLSEKILRHTLGASDDAVVYTELNPSYYIGVYKSKSSQYIIIWNSSTLSSDFQILNANTPTANFTQFTPREDVHEYNIDHFQDKFYVLTNWQAKNFRLMETPQTATAKENWTEVIPHRKDVFIEDIELFRNQLLITERQTGLTKFRVINQKTQDEHYVQFPEDAYMAGLSVNPEFDTETFRFTYSSLTTPSTVFDYHMVNRTQEQKKQQEVVGGHEPSNYETKRLFATARDGSKIPISIVYKKGFERNAESPMLLYAYGSYGHTIDPYFSSMRLSLLDRGFSFAIAHIRGGQLLGRDWYDQGKMLNKTNTFFDFIDCAQYLLQEKYTRTSKLFAMGGSAGGLLMGAIVNYNPELWRGVVAAVPFVDVLSTMSDPTIPLTTNEYDEWGNPDQKPYYDYMKSYSPYDNVTAQDYPNMLITTGLFDSQVQYWEPAKWVAKLRELKTDNNQLLLHTDMEAGHGGASGRFKRYRESALEYAFMFDLVGIKK